MNGEEKQIVSEIDELVEEHMTAKSDTSRYELRDRLLVVAVRAVKTLVIGFGRMEDRMGKVEKAFEGNGVWGVKRIARWVSIRSKIELFFFLGVVSWVTISVMPDLLHRIFTWLGGIGQ